MLPGLLRRQRVVQWNMSKVPVAGPVQLPTAQPAQLPHTSPEHSPSLVHQQGTPAPLHVPAVLVTFEQLPAAQAQASGEALRISQPTESVAPPSTDPEQVPVHCPLTFAHLPLVQSESAAQRHVFETTAGGGTSGVTHAFVGVPLLSVLTTMNPYDPPPPPFPEAELLLQPMPWYIPTHCPARPTPGGTTVELKT
jgi:hypothetical protein